MSELFHSTVSRRTFMKSLGMVATGAAALTLPVYHDLDEMKSDDAAIFKNPWWVKEVDEPTVEIDWNTLKPCDSRIACNDTSVPEKYHGTEFGFKPGYWEELSARARDNKINWMKENRPGYTVKDWALRQSVTAPPGASFPWVADKAAYFPTQGAIRNPHVGEVPRGPAEIQTEGIPKYQGTPEENARMLKVARRFFGSDVIGSTLFDQRQKQLLYSNNCVVENVDEGYTNAAGKKVIPGNVQMYYSLGFYQESNDMWSRAPGGMVKSAHYLGNRNMQMEASSAHRFIAALYYQSLHGGGGMAPAPAVGVLAGMNELGRPGNSLNPVYGMGSAGSSGMILTDLPLAPDKPIDSGAMRFCDSCHRCSDACPGGAIVGEPRSWDVYGPWSNPGKKAFQNKMNLCRDGFFLLNFCLLCTANCVFTKHNSASIHVMVKQIASVSPVFNSFFTNMDGLFGYGTAGINSEHNPDSDATFNPRAAEWWNEEHAKYGQHIAET
ncbi:reductive dehalogenase [Dehalogenimonas sp. WBC-2]|nr:reductive dehalogenase [Dehalogenimonas sp. WBC-2]